MRVQTEYFINEHMYVTFWLSNVIFKACFRIGWIAFPSTEEKEYTGKFILRYETPPSYLNWLHFYL